MRTDDIAALRAQDDIAALRAQDDIAAPWAQGDGARRQAQGGTATGRARPRGVTLVAPLLMTAVLGLATAGCSRRHTTIVTTTTATVVTTTTLTSPAPTATGPIGTGPVTTATGTCPYIDEEAAAEALGIRLGRVAVVSAGGAPVGCLFYPTTDPYYVAEENLPGPNQAVLSIMSAKYATSTYAHNAIAIAGKAGGQAHSATIAGGIVGVAYQTALVPADNGQDWAFAFSLGTTAVTVIAGQDDSELDPEDIAGQIAPKF